MLKSLERLKDARVLGFDGYELFNDLGDNLADEIQAEVDRYYLPRPLDTNGNPVDVGATYTIDDTVHYSPVTIDDIYVAVVDDTGDRWHDVPSYQFKPYEPDSQNRIDADAEMGPKAYCEKYGLPVHTGPGTYPRQLQIADLLKRQRDLCARGDA